jgi:hypothetical protein
MLVLPSLLSMLLLGSSLTTPVELVLARTAGVALLTLGVACWLARDDVQSRAAIGVIGAMLLYNIGVALLLVYAALGLVLSGILLWPFVLVHLGMAIWCVMRLRNKTAQTVEVVKLTQPHERRKGWIDLPNSTGY